MTSFKRLRKYKYYALKAGVHRIIPSRHMIFTGLLGELSQWITAHRDIPFTDFPNPKFVHERRFALYEWIAANHLHSEPVDYMEFGVAKGRSFKWWVKTLTHPDTRFYGFDTFTGLPEAWGPFEKGAMSSGNKPPEIEGGRHHFFQGAHPVPGILAKEPDTGINGGAAPHLD